MNTLAPTVWVMCVHAHMHTHAHTHCTLTHIRNGHGRGLTTTVKTAKKVNTDREPEQEGLDAPELREFRQWLL